MRLPRNSWKYVDRDKRTEKQQLIEYDFLAPDTINEILDSLELFQRLTGEAWKRKYNGSSGDASIIGRDLLEKNDPSLKNLEIIAADFENTGRAAKLLKVPAAYHLFKELVRFYAGSLLIELIQQNKLKSFDELSLFPPPPCNFQMEKYRRATRAKLRISRKPFLTSNQEK